MPLDLNWRFDDPVSALSNIYAFLYYFLAKEMVESFGKEGEAALCHALDEYGKLRGKLLRERHEAEGIPISIKSFWEHYDLPFDVRTSRNRQIINETESYSECYTCQFNDIWRHLDHTREGEPCRLAQIYCERFYRAMCRAYCGNMTLEFPQNLAKGDPQCAIYAVLE